MDDVTTFKSGRNKELVEMAEKVLKELKRVVEERCLKLSITERRERDERARPSLPASIWRRGFRESIREREPSIWEAKEKARRKCDVRFSLVTKNRLFQKNYTWIGVRKLLRTGLVLARAWRGEVVGSVPTEKLKLRRQMAAVAGKKESVSLSFFF